MSRTAREWERAPQLPPTHFLDNRIYTDESIFEAEIENIWHKVWKFVCHESEVAEPGDYRTMEVARIPILVVRGEDGAVRTFQNTCSHRGAKVVQGLHGNATRFTCVFHLWVYDAQGNCVSMTRNEAYESAGCRAEDMGLREIRTAVRLGLVFINFDDDAEPIDDFLGDGLENAAAVLGTEPLEVYHYHEQIVDANWKHLQEVNCESYHAFMHSINRRQTIRAAGYHERTWKFYRRGHATLLGPLIVQYDAQPGWKKERDGVPLPGLGPREFRVVDVWPDTAMIMRDSAMRIDTMTPLGVDRTLVQFRGIGVKGEPEAARLARYNDHNTLWGPFGWNVPEDNAAAIIQQEATYGSASYSVIAREENLMAHDEANLRQYYAEWERRMGRSARDPLAAAGAAGAAGAA